jgi:hypothetical protein
VVVVRLAVVILGVVPATIVLGVVALAVFRAVVLPGMLRIIALAAVIGAVVVTLRGPGRSRIFGSKPGETSIARRRRCWSAACNSDLKRPGRRGKMDDHIRSVGDFGPVCHAHASHI